jgi:hypothetical protein
MFIVETLHATFLRAGAVMNAGRVILLVIGIIALLAGLSVLFIGGSLVCYERTHVDSDGFVTSDSVDLASSAYAVAAGPVEINAECPNTPRFVQRLGTMKIEGKNNDSSQGVFIGIAREEDFEQYLGDVEYDKISWIDNLYSVGKNVEYDNNAGDSTPTDPTAQTFWQASAYGTGTQTLVWEPQGEREKLSGIVLGIGIALLVGGLLALIIGGLMIYLSLHNRKKSEKKTSVVTA